MMKRRLTTLAVVVIAVLLIAEVAGCGKDTASVADNTQTAAAVENTVKPEVAATPTREATDEFIGVEKAKELILKDLGVSEATFVERETELDDMEYEFEVIVGDKEYDYEVHAVSGAIVEKDVDRMDAEDKAEAAKKATDKAAADKAADKAATDKVADNTASEKISLEKAKEIALADLGNSNAKLVEKEFDDGKYELEFYADGVEYKYEINAKTGKIVDKEVDKEVDKDHH